jgi:hypothetical protein
MAPWSRRALTAGEIAIAREMFPATAIDWRRITILQVDPRAPWGAMVPLGCQIIFAGWLAATDFAEAELAEQGWFMHELAHIWQAARGVPLALAKLAAIGRAAYRADWSIPRAFAAYKIEQQANIFRFAFLARRGRVDPAGPSLRRLAALWPGQDLPDACVTFARADFAPCWCRRGKSPHQIGRTSWPTA